MDNQTTVGQQFKILNIIHAALCAGVIVILVLFRYLVKKETAPAENNVLFEVAGVVIAFICVMSSRFLFFMRTKSALSVASLKEKIDIFRSAFIVQMALLDGAAVTNCLFYLIGKNDLNFFVGLGVMLLMLFRRPTRVMAAMVLFNPNEDLQQIYDNSLPL